MNLFKNRTVVGVICIMLSLLICFGVTPLFNKSVSQKTEIVRVTKEIKAGDEITKDMVQTVEVGGFGLPENVIRQSETVIGKYAVYRRAVAVIAMLGLLALLISNRSWVHGVSAGFLTLAIAQVLIDHFSQERAEDYSRALSSQEASLAVPR